MPCDPITLRQGETWRLPMYLKADGEVRDLTGWKVRGALFERVSDATAKAAFDSEAGTVEITIETGKIVFVLPSDESAELDIDGAERWLFDFELYQDNVSPEIVERGFDEPLVIPVIRRGPFSE